MVPSSKTWAYPKGWGTYPSLENKIKITFLLKDFFQALICSLIIHVPLNLTTSQIHENKKEYFNPLKKFWVRPCSKVRKKFD